MSEDAHTLPPLITRRKAAAMLGCHPRTLCRMIVAKTIPTVEGTKLLRRADIEAFADARPIRPSRVVPGENDQ